MLKRRVPVNESVVGRDPFSFGAAAPKLCNVDSAQAAADVGEKSTSPPALFDVAFGLGIGEDEEDFFRCSAVPVMLKSGLFLDVSFPEFLSPAITGR